MRTLASFAGFARLVCLKDDPKRVEIVEDALKRSSSTSAEGYEKSVQEIIELLEECLSRGPACFYLMWVQCFALARGALIAASHTLFNQTRAHA